MASPSCLSSNCSHQRDKLGDENTYESCRKDCGGTATSAHLNDSEVVTQHLLKSCFGLLAKGAVSAHQGWDQAIADSGYELQRQVSVIDQGTHDLEKMTTFSLLISPSTKL